MTGTRYVCQKCGEEWQQKEKKDPDQCPRCHEWVRPFDEAHKEKQEAKK